MDQQLHELNILIIEDNPADQFLLQENLEATQLKIEKIVIASTLAQGIDFLQQHTCSLIFLDFYLPDSSGLNSFIELNKVNPKVPMIILSGLEETGAAMKAISLGAQDFLSKREYTVESLEKAVRYSIERKRNLQLIEENNERYDIISKATNDVIWDWNLATGKVTWRGQGLVNYLPPGMPEENMPDDFWVNGLHPEERKKTTAKLRKAIFKNDGSSWGADNRFLRSDGSYAYVNTRGYVMMNAEGKPMRMIGCMQDITDRKTAEIEAHQSKLAADEARKTQEQFLANMSHEIRTPMNGVIGMTQLLAGTSLTAEQKEYVETIRDSADNLMVIINDILDLTKIAAGKITIDQTDYVFGDIIKNSIQINRFKATEKGLNLRSAIDPRIHRVLAGDPFRLNQILVNLVGNAIKFTEAGDVSVTVHLLEESRENVHLQFIVKDTGIGIEPDKLDTVFERFTQASSATTRKYGGTGLGLTITRQLIELQGGSIHVTSKPGHGSTFTFYLTIKKGCLSTAETSALSLPTNTQTLEGVRILLVEDNLVNQKVAVKILSLQGADVTIANHGLEAIELLPGGEFDVVLMDIQMPELDGYETTKYIRKKMQGPFTSIPIIAMTASALISEKDKCLIAGMDDYITKPFQAKALFEKIRNQLTVAAAR
ncbi:MAG: response regulator [Bacteroidota bacterium]